MAYSFFSADDVIVAAMTRDRGFTYAFPDGRPNCALIYTERGKMCYEFLDGDRPPVTAPAGTLMILPAGVRHRSVYAEDGTTVKNVQFVTSGQGTPVLLQSPTLLSYREIGEYIQPLFERPFSSTESDRMYLSHLLCGFLWHLLRLCDSEDRRRFRVLEPFFARMRNAAAEDAPIGEYAALCGISEPHFRRLFRECTGESPLAYRNRLRLEEAERLLSTGEYSVEEAATTVGFCNFSFFCRAFRKHFGHTPSGRM